MGHNNMSGLSLTFDIHTFVLAGIGGTTIQIKISGLGRWSTEGRAPSLTAFPQTPLPIFKRWCTNMMTN